MKKLLMASSAFLLAGVGAQAMEGGVSISGTAFFGVKYNESMDDSLSFHHEFDIKFEASGTTDGGIGFGASTTIDNNESVSGTVTGTGNVKASGAGEQINLSTTGALTISERNLTGNIQSDAAADFNNGMTGTIRSSNVMDITLNGAISNASAEFNDGKTEELGQIGDTHYLVARVDDGLSSGASPATSASSPTTGGGFFEAETITQALARYYTEGARDRNGELTWDDDGDSSTPEVRVGDAKWEVKIEARTDTDNDGINDDLGIAQNCALMGSPNFVAATGSSDGTFISLDAYAAYNHVQTVINGNVNDANDNGNPDLRLVACKHLGSDITDIDDLNSNTSDFRQIMGTAVTDPESVGLDASHGVSNLFQRLGEEHAFNYGGLAEENASLGIQALDADGNLAVENADGDIVTAVDFRFMSKDSYLSGLNATDGLVTDGSNVEIPDVGIELCYLASGQPPDAANPLDCTSANRADTVNPSGIQIAIDAGDRELRVTGKIENISANAQVLAGTGDVVVEGSGTVSGSIENIRGTVLTVLPELSTSGSLRVTGDVAVTGTSTVTGESSGTVANNATVYLESGAHKITIGDNDAGDLAAGGVADVGFDGLGVDDVAEGINGNTNPMFRYDGSFGVGSIAVSLDGAEDWAAGFKFDLAPVSLGVGIASDDSVSLGLGVSQGPMSANALYSTRSMEGSDDDTAFGVDVGFQMNDGTKLVVVLSQSEMGGAKKDGFGIGMEHDLSGGLTLMGGFAQVDDNTVADLGLKMAF